MPRWSAKRVIQKPYQNGGNASSNNGGTNRWVNASTIAKARSEANIRTRFVDWRARQTRSINRVATKAKPQMKIHRSSVSASGESSISTAAMEKIQVVKMQTTGTGKRIKTLWIPLDNPLRNRIFIYDCMSRSIHIGKLKLWFLTKLLLLRKEIVTRAREFVDQCFAFQFINRAKLFEGAMFIANGRVD